MRNTDVERKVGGRDSRTEQNAVVKGLPESRSSSTLMWVERRTYMARDTLKGHLVELTWRTMEDHGDILRTVFSGCWLQPN